MCANIFNFLSRTISEITTMDANKMDLLDQLREKIVESVDIPNTIIDLRKYNIFDQDDQDKFHQMSNLTSREKCSTLLSLVKSRGDRAFWAFSHLFKTKTPEIYMALHDNCKVNAKEDCAMCKIEDGFSMCQNCLGESFEPFLHEEEANLSPQTP